MDINILLRLGRPAKLGLNDGGRATCLAGVTCALPPGANTPYWSSELNCSLELVSLMTPARHHRAPYTPPPSYKSVWSIFTSSLRGSSDFQIKKIKFEYFKKSREIIRGRSTNLPVRLSVSLLKMITFPGFVVWLWALTAEHSVIQCRTCCHPVSYIKNKKMTIKKTIILSVEWKQLRASENAVLRRKSEMTKRETERNSTMKSFTNFTLHYVILGIQNQYGWDDRSTQHDMVRWEMHTTFLSENTITFEWLQTGRGLVIGFIELL